MSKHVLTHRAEIDGLRALAVVPVILFHAGFELFSGGFVGVDVFFVISGYLITTILIEDIENKRFSIVNFYERRARRILPALSVVILFTVFGAWVLLSDTALDKFGDGVIGVALFISNIIFWRQQGYFHESAGLNPILHTWSLSVEEQYYLAFPIFLFLAWRFGKNKVLWIIVVMAIISLLLGAWYAGGGGGGGRVSANFYLAPTRAWELFSGSIAAFIVQRKGVQKNNIIALLGLAAIIFFIFACDESTPFPSVYYLVPVVGTVLLILYAEKETFVAKLLSARAFTAIGLVSYSAYLWHQPIFAFTRAATNEIALNIELRLFLIVVTFVLSYFSWNFIETPFRSKSIITRRTFFLLIPMALVAMGLFGLASKNAVKGSEYSLAKLLSQEEYVYFQNMDERKFVKGRLIYPLKNPDNLVIGSSRVMQVNPDVVGGSLINLAVSGASIEDDIAFSLEAMEKLKVNHVYIAADPWLINKFDEQYEYKSVDKLYEYWLENAEQGNVPKAYLTSDMQKDIDLLQEGLLVSIRKKLHRTDLSLPKHGHVEAVAKKAYSGFHIYKESDANRIMDIVSDSLNSLNYGMSQFEYDEKAIEKLRLLVIYLKQNSVTISLILSPYHPDLYTLMESDKPIFLEIEDWFRLFSQENDIEIIGSYNPNLIDCGRDEFYDGMHPKASCMAKVFNNSK